MYSLLILFVKGISLDNTNVKLVPVSGKLYVYKADIQTNDDFQDSRLRSGPFAYIVRVSSLDNNVTSYSLLVSMHASSYVNYGTVCVIQHDPITDVVDLTQYSAHCKSANISVAVVTSDGISEYSSLKKMCITGMCMVVTIMSVPCVSFFIVIL